MTPGAQPSALYPVTLGFKAKSSRHLLRDTVSAHEPVKHMVAAMHVRQRQRWKREGPWPSVCVKATTAPLG